jgi:hypothetical protein
VDCPGERRELWRQILLAVLELPGCRRALHVMRTATRAIIALLDRSRRTPANSVACRTVGLELTAADDERQDGCGLSVFVLGLAPTARSPVDAVEQLARERSPGLVLSALFGGGARRRGVPRGDRGGPMLPSGMSSAAEISWWAD